MTAERSSEDNDGRQVRATIGRAAGYALHCRSVRHNEVVSGSFGTEDVDRCKVHSKLCRSVPENAGTIRASII
jgi:hypothetical protein